MNKIRVGIIGTGMIANRHMTIYTHCPNAEVVAIAEIRPDVLKAFGDKYGIPEENRYADFREMLKRDDLDTIDVCVHNNLHASVSIAVMKAGYDCYCEKPMAATYADGKMMIDAAKKLGRKFHVQISSLMTSQTRVARDMIANGDLGNLYYVNLTYVSHRRRPGYDLPMFTTDFYTKKWAGHGASIDLGVYAISQLLYVCGMPKLKSVSGFATRGLEYDDRLITNPEGFTVEDLSCALAKFENGLNMQLLMTGAANIDDHVKTYILGSKGGLELFRTDMGGGVFARAPKGKPVPPDMKHPELTFYGDYAKDGRDMKVDLNVWDNSLIDARVHPEISLYDDNQVMWLAYKEGVMGDGEDGRPARYNTPEIALEFLKLTDGMFLSSELGREVTADEIVGLSKSMAVIDQETPFGVIHYDNEV